MSDIVFFFFIGSVLIVATLLATPNFIAGVNDKLAAIDVYAKNTKAVVNKIQDIAKLFDVDLTSLLKGGDAIAQAFPLIKSVKDGLIELNKENLVARLTGLSKNVANAVKQMGGEFFDQLGNVQLIKDVAATVDGVTSYLKDVSYASLSAISDLVSQVTGDPTLFRIQDKEAAAALFTGLIKEASSKGISNTFKAVVSKIKDSDVLNSVIANVLPDVIDKSDVRMLASIVQSDGSKVTRLLDSRLIDKFASKYSFGLGFEPSKVQQAFKEVRETFDLINPSWNRYITPVQNGIARLANATVITQASADFKKGMLDYIKLNNQDLPTEDKLLSLGTVFDSVSVDVELQKRFPFHVKPTNTAFGSK